MRRLGYYSKLSGQVPQESDPQENLLAHTLLVTSYLITMVTIDIRVFKEVNNSSFGVGNNQSPHTPLPLFFHYILK